MNPTPNKKPVTIWDNEPVRWSDFDPSMAGRIAVNDALRTQRIATAQRLAHLFGRLERLERDDARRRAGLSTPVL